MKITLVLVVYAHTLAAAGATAAIAVSTIAADNYRLWSSRHVLLVSWLLARATSLGARTCMPTFAAALA
jgi:hypothetical protein